MANDAINFILETAILLDLDDTPNFIRKCLISPRRDLSIGKQALVDKNNLKRK